ncbi:Uncharacterized protein PBTT_08298 [Plasmodiophora brassicae]
MSALPHRPVVLHWSRSRAIVLAVSAVGLVNIAVLLSRSFQGPPHVVVVGTSDEYVTSSTPTSTAAGFDYDPTFAGDRFLTYGLYGRLTNNVIALAHAMSVARETRRKVLVPPLVTATGDIQYFAYAWLHVFDIDALNEYLRPGSGPCLIRGWNHQPDAVVVRYIETGINADPDRHCLETPFDAPRMLRDPSSWSSSCNVLPWTHIGVVAGDASPLGMVPDEGRPFTEKLPGDWQCQRRDFNLTRVTPTSIGGRNLSLVLDEEAGPDRLILYDGGTIYWRSLVDRPLSPLPVSAGVRQAADALLAGIRDRLLCMHIRREDMATTPMADFLGIATSWRRDGKVHDLFVITNGDAGDIADVSAAFPNAVIGCAPASVPACNSPARAAIVEQYACSLADYFLGSPESSFSYRIEVMRRRAGRPADTGAIVHPGGRTDRAFWDMFDRARMG